MGTSNFTGAYLLPEPSEPTRRQFGMVSGSFADGEPAEVSILLRCKDTDVQVSIEDVSAIVKISEDKARVLLDVLRRTLDKLADLRGSPRDPKPE
jgi:hypothetical protein